MAAVMGGSAWLIARGSSHHETYHEIVDAVVVRYADASIRDAEAVRRRLLKDPMYPFLIGEAVLEGGLRVLDLGCGRGAAGVLLGLLTRGSEPRSYHGVDRSERYVRAARRALEDFPGCAASALDLRDFDPPPADVVIVNDVLRFLPIGSQDALLRRLARALPPGSRVFLREKNAGGGWRFAWSAFIDAATILLPGHPRGGTHYRRSGDLRNALIAAGFTVHDRSSASTSSPVWGMVEAVRRPTTAGRA
jgi:SAM-dependent methyltransferase